jgi:hypothetical protein
MSELTVKEAAAKIASMKHPSIPDLLRKRGFGYEADRVQELMDASERAAAPKKGKKKETDIEARDLALHLASLVLTGAIPFSIQGHPILPAFLRKFGHEAAANHVEQSIEASRKHKIIIDYHGACPTVHCSVRDRDRIEFHAI